MVIGLRKEKIFFIQQFNNNALFYAFKWFSREIFIALWIYLLTYNDNDKPFYKQCNDKTVL